MIPGGGLVFRVQIGLILLTLLTLGLLVYGIIMEDSYAAQDLGSKFWALNNFLPRFLYLAESVFALMSAC